jgi:hypothetical protein
LAYIGSEQEMKMPEPQRGRPRTLEAFRVRRERPPRVREFIGGAPKLVTPGSKSPSLIDTHAALAEALRGTGCHSLVEGADIEVRGPPLVADIVVACAPLDQRRDDGLFLTSIAPADPLRLEPQGLGVPLAPINARGPLE